MQVLDRRWKNKSNRMVEQVLIKWSGNSMDETWEDFDELHTRFPCASAWGQTVSQDGGGVSISTANRPEAQEEPKSNPDAAQPSDKRRRNPNPRFIGHQWVNCISSV